MSESKVTATAGGDLPGPFVVEGVKGKTPPKKGRPRGQQPPVGSRMVVMGGTRTEKGFPLTEDELWSLAQTGAGAALSFSAAGASLQYYLDVSLNLALAQGVPERILEHYETNRHWSVWLAVGFAALGVLLFYVGGSRVRRIIRATKHDEEQEG